MLNLNSIMLGTMQPKVMGEFYKQVFDKEPDMTEGEWSGWQVGSSFFSVGEHSEMKGASKEGGRIMFNLETSDVKEEFERISKIEGIKIIKEPYEMGEMWIATFADPDENYFQLMTPWEEEPLKN